MFEVGVSCFNHHCLLMPYGINKSYTMSTSVYVWPVPGLQLYIGIFYEGLDNNSLNPSFFMFIAALWSRFIVRPQSHL